MPMCIHEHFASSWCNTFLFGYILCQIHLSKADMHGFTEFYLQKNFHSQTKMALQNKEAQRKGRSAVLKISPSSVPCPQLYVHWTPGIIYSACGGGNVRALLFLKSCPFTRKRCDPGISGRSKKMKVLEEVPGLDLNIPSIYPPEFLWALNTWF